MNALFYKLSYWLGMSRWDSGVTPPEVVQAFSEGDIPNGPVLDLGCGTGTNVIYMANQGRQAYGIDFVPQAIAKARKKAKQAGVSDQVGFLVADVTRINNLKLPRFAFALDMGCFHGLSQEGQRAYAQGLSEVLMPGGRYMLYAIEPRKETLVSFGMTPEQVKPVFEPWFEIEHMEGGSFWDRKSTWFYMKRRQDGAEN